MKKKIFGRKLSRDYGSRKALFRALTRSLILKGSIVTTKAKAKAISASVEKLITSIKKGSLTHIRLVNAKLANDRQALTKLVKQIAPALSDIKGGYTKIISLPSRKGDNAEMVKIVWTREFANLESKIDGKKKKSKKEEKVDKTKNQKSKNSSDKIKKDQKTKK